MSSMLALVNAERARDGAPPLAADNRLHAAALHQCQHMYSTNKLTHDGPEGMKLGERVSRAGFTWRMCAENVALGYQGEEAAVTGWMGSTGHRENILNRSATHMGWAHVGKYWVQVFARI